jgi:hypothetical protein
MMDDHDHDHDDDDDYDDDDDDIWWFNMFLDDV